MTLAFNTKECYDFIDITEKVTDFVKKSGIKNGLVNVQSMHTTCAIIVNEAEPLLFEDMKKNFRETAKHNIAYNHDNFDIRTVNMCGDECKNGHSHCLAAYMPTSVTLNLVDNKVHLGQWQRIFLLELDHSRPRKVNVQLIGN